MQTETSIGVALIALAGACAPKVFEFGMKLLGIQGDSRQREAQEQQTREARLEAQLAAADERRQKDLDDYRKADSEERHGLRNRVTELQLKTANQDGKIGVQEAQINAQERQIADLRLQVQDCQGMLSKTQGLLEDMQILVRQMRGGTDHA